MRIRMTMRMRLWNEGLKKTDRLNRLAAISKLIAHCRQRAPPLALSHAVLTQCTPCSDPGCCCPLYTPFSRHRGSIRRRQACRTSSRDEQVNCRREVVLAVSAREAAATGRVGVESLTQVGPWVCCRGTGSSSWQLHWLRHSDTWHGTSSSGVVSSGLAAGYSGWSRLHCGLLHWN